MICVLPEWAAWLSSQSESQVPCPTEGSSGVCRIKLPSLSRHILTTKNQPGTWARTCDPSITRLTLQPTELSRLTKFHYSQIFFQNLQNRNGFSNDGYSVWTRRYVMMKRHTRETYPILSMGLLARNRMNKRAKKRIVYENESTIISGRFHLQSYYQCSEISNIYDVILIWRVML